MKLIFSIIFLLASPSGILIAQTPVTPNFKTVVEGVLKTRFQNASFATVCPLTDPTAARVFSDYGAIFIANGVRLPGRCIFANDLEVDSFQSLADPEVATVGRVQLTLQKAAMAAFLAARQEAKKEGLAISPRGGPEASTRSYSKTLDLWRSRFIPGLRYWTAKGRIGRDDGAAAQAAPISEQVTMVLAWEKKGIYFSKDLSKSILYSVAVPGASQHIFMLALDIEQFGNRRVRQILAEWGWFQTVKSDLPHFTYLGVAEVDLPSLGLKREVFAGQEFWIPNM